MNVEGVTIHSPRSSKENFWSPESGNGPVQHLWEKFLLSIGNSFSQEITEWWKLLLYSAFLWLLWASQKKSILSWDGKIVFTNYEVQCGFPLALYQRSFSGQCLEWPAIAGCFPVKYWVAETSTYVLGGKDLYSFCENRKKSFTFSLPLPILMCSYMEAQKGEPQKNPLWFPKQRSSFGATNWNFPPHPWNPSALSLHLSFTVDFSLG